MADPGESVTQRAQGSRTTVLCTAVKTTTSTGGYTIGVGTPTTGISVDGYNGAQMVEVTAVGTVAAQAASFRFEGSYDNVNFYIIGMQEVDGVAAPTRVAAAATTTPGNGTTRTVWQLLDPYKYVRVNITANTLVTGLTASLYAVPI